MRKFLSSRLSRRRVLGTATAATGAFAASSLFPHRVFSAEPGSQDRIPGPADRETWRRGASPDSTDAESGASG